MTPLQKWKRHRDASHSTLDVGMDLGDWDDDGAGEGGQALQLFDLSLRAEALSAEKKVWAAPAMELALTIRNGGVRTIRMNE